jgi:hypothetical protein
MRGRHLIGLSNANRQAAGVVTGDEVKVDVEFDPEPRVVAEPADLARALDADPFSACSGRQKPTISAPSWPGLARTDRSEHDPRGWLGNRSWRHVRRSVRKNDLGYAFLR